MRSLIVIAFISLVGCSTFQSVKLPLPVMAELPKAAHGSLDCLSDDAFRVLEKREIIMEGHIDKLEGIIKATHK